jgi:hypothetical protein
LFSKFVNPAIIDLPGYNYETLHHEEERNLLKKFFDAQHHSEKESVRESYNRLAFDHHKKIKNDFIKALGESHDLVLGYFSIADVIGHLNFGNAFLMRMIYRDLDEIAGGIDSPFLVVSDHGMKPIGFFGDHSSYGFWSSGEHDLGKPKITDFKKIILDLFHEQKGV